MTTQTPHVTDRNGLEVLTRNECMALLSAGGLGRVGVTMRALPVVLPVSYAVFDGDVVFRTGSGTKLAAAVEHSVIAFEADWLDATTGAGWSVCITGVATPVGCPSELSDMHGLPFKPLPPGLRQHVIRISSDIVSGRILRCGPDAG